MTLWNENIVVLNSRIVAANATLWHREMNLRSISIICATYWYWNKI